MLINVGVPIGFSAGGWIATHLVRSFGWPAIFVLGGALPIFFAPLLALWMPDSFAPRPGKSRGNPVRELFQGGLASKTLLLWSINALSYLSIYFMLLWTPALLHSKGVSASRAILATTIYGLGLIVSPVLIALVADHFGLEPVLTCGLLFGGLCILLVGLLQPGYCPLSLLLCGAGVGGGCQGGINSLSVLSYPHSIRSTGVGWALGVGRLGTIAGPLLGGLLLSLDVGIRKIFVAASIPVCCAAVMLAFLGRLQQRRIMC
jgi:AAHS family 4-hydroxybenzoate transporter-like MFS transporter